VTFGLFLEASCSTEIAAVMMAIREIADKAFEQLDEIEASPDSLCMTHSWDRLRVWLPRADEPIAPAGCASPITIL